MTKSLHLKLGKILFKLAEKNNSSDETYAQLKALTVLVADKNLLFKIKHLNDIEVQGLVKFAKADLQLNELMTNLLVIVWKSRLTDLLPGILKTYQKNYFEKAKISEVELITARDFSEKEMGKIIKNLEDKTDRKLEINSTVSKELIGGIQIFKDGKLTDLSVKARLDQLKQALSN